MTLSKIEVAMVQLDAAIQLFMNGDYVSSLTLSGAAEEILGKLCERAGQPVALEQIVRFHWNDTDASLPDDERSRILKGILNGPRNAAKHANDPSEVSFEVDPDFPLQMIMRAMPMARSLGCSPIHEEEMVRRIKSRFAND